MGKARTTRLSTPTIVSAATMALRIASSTACTVPARSDGTLPDHERTVAFDQGRVPDLDSRDVGDRVHSTNDTGERNAEIACTRSRADADRQQQRQKEDGYGLHRYRIRGGFS